MTKRILLLCCLLLSMHGMAQTNLYVDSSVVTSGAGTTWATAYKSVSQALSVANAASTTIQYNIHVAKGTYYPMGIPNASNRDSAFLIARGGIRVYGGYPTGGGIRNPATHTTKLSGEAQTSTAFDNAYHVIVASNIPATADSVILDGLTVTMGSANGSGTKTYNGLSVIREYGGAMYIISVAAKMLIHDCRIQSNFTFTNGGIYNTGSSGLVVSACLFTGNSATLGGGIYNIAGSTVIVNSTFSNNTADGGGAIYNKGAGTGATKGSMISGCTFNNNSAPAGGAMYMLPVGTYADSIINCTFTGNSGGNGGAVYYGCNNMVPVFSHCTFTGNTATNSAGGLYVTGTPVQGTVAVITHCDFTGNKSAGLGGGLVSVSPYQSATPTSITYCTFTNDTAGNGGGLLVIGPNRISHCRILSNRATTGGGLAISGGTNVNYICDYDTIAGNAASGNGGGIHFDAGHFYPFRNMQITGNSAVNGGGVFAVNSEGLSFGNVTIAGNSATQQANGIYNSNYIPTIQNSIIWNGTTNNIVNATSSAVVASYSTLQDGYPGFANTSADPLFISPLPGASAPTISGDYQLQPCSPAKNIGLTSAAYGLFDLAGNPRLSGSAVDHGAFEVQPGSTTPITGNNTVCPNSTLQLSNATPGGTWTSTTPAVATVNSSGLLTGISAGTDTIVYTLNSAPYCGAEAKMIITVTSINAAINQSGPTLTALPAGAAYSYQWLSCATNQPIPGAVSQVYTAGSDGQYAVIVSDGNCTDTSSCVTVTGLSVAGNDHESGVYTYPNPVSGQLTVAAKNITPSLIALTDITGRRLMQLRPVNPTTDIDVRSLPPGFYFLEVIAGEHRVIRKIELVR